MEFKMPEFMQDHQKLFRRIVLKAYIVEEAAFCRGHLGPPALEEGGVGGVELDVVVCEEIADDALKQPMRRGADGVAACSSARSGLLERPHGDVSCASARQHCWASGLILERSRISS